MVGMLQIITWMLGIYLIFKGIEILQIGLSSTSSSRKLMIWIGFISVIASVVIAVELINQQDMQAATIHSSIAPGVE